MKKTIAVLLFLSLFIFQASAFDLLFGSDEVTQNREVTLTLDSSAKFFRDKAVLPTTVLGISLDGPVGVRASFEENLLGTSPTIKELALSITFADYLLESGLLKLAWGVGDASHVVDVANPYDYSNGLSDDLQSLKQATPMVRLLRYFDNSSLEAVVSLGFVAGTMATSGRWSLLPTSFSATTFTSPDTKTLSYLQGGARYRMQSDILDFALIYYTGYWPQAGYMNIALPSLATADIAYTRYNMFGFEASKLVGNFTFFAEGAYFLSDDADGTKAELYNSRLEYLGGVSYQDPVSQAFLSATYQGHYTLQFDKTSTSAFDVEALQADDGKAYGNIINLAFDMLFMRDLMKLTLGGTYQMESQGYVLLGSLTYTVRDNLEAYAKAFVYGSGDGKSSMFNTWKDNDYIQIGMKAWF